MTIDGASDGLNDVISRLDHMIDGSTTVESYQYLGLSTVVVRQQPAAGIALTYAAQIGDSYMTITDGGDQYVGLDRFGRVVDQDWIDTNDGNNPVDRYQYAYDANSNVTAKNNLIYDAYHAQDVGSGDLDQAYSYDALNRLTASNDESFTMDALGNIRIVHETRAKALGRAAGQGAGRGMRQWRAFADKLPQ